MGLFTPDEKQVDDFQQLYKRQLRVLLTAERQILRGLRGMAAHAQDPQLREVLEKHMQETEVHVTRMEELVGHVHGGDADEENDPIATALIDSVGDIESESEEGPVRDAWLLATAQKVEHYEIASYGAARSWARLLDLPRHLELLEQTLNEEKHSNELLNGIADRANAQALAA